jgi:hypothetical protein
VTQHDPFERWLADAGWAEEVDETMDVVDGADGQPDPWRGAVLVVDGLSDAQREFLDVDQPVQEHLRPELPGIEGFEE